MPHTIIHPLNFSPSRNFLPAPRSRISHTIPSPRCSPAGPATTPCSSLPQDYLERVRETHQTGGWGSTGYGYAWQEAEAEKNLLRTHTTAVSSRMLYRLAQNGFRPAKYFSIDRVFRNEAVDRTHLAEFHQIEGVVAGVGLTLGDLIGTLTEFFARLGLPTLRFKPAYNPYTEPSMEIFRWGREEWRGQEGAQGGPGVLAGCPHAGPVPWS